MMSYAIDQDAYKISIFFQLFFWGPVFVVTVTFWFYLSILCFASLVVEVLAATLLFMLFCLFYCSRISLYLADDSLHFGDLNSGAWKPPKKQDGKKLPWSRKPRVDGRRGWTYVMTYKNINKRAEGKKAASKNKRDEKVIRKMQNKFYYTCSIDWWVDIKVCEITQCISDRSLEYLQPLCK